MIVVEVSGTMSVSIVYTSNLYSVFNSRCASFSLYLYTYIHVYLCSCGLSSLPSEHQLPTCRGFARTPDVRLSWSLVGDSWSLSGALGCLLGALWSLLDGFWSVLKGSWGMAVVLKTCVSAWRLQCSWFLGV